jgi:hypothetical protein
MSKSDKVFKSVEVYPSIELALANMHANIDLKGKVISAVSIEKVREVISELVDGLDLEIPYQSYLAFSNHLDCGCLNGIRVLCFNDEDSVFKPANTLDLVVSLHHEALVSPNKFH